MFDNVGKGTQVQRGRQASSLILTLLLNGTLMGGLVWAGSRVVENVEAVEELIEVAVDLAPPPPPPPPPPAGGSKKKKEKKVEEEKPKEEIVPTEVVPLPEPEPVEEEEDEGVEGGVEGGVAGGVVGGVVGGVEGGVLGGQLGGTGLKKVHWSEVQPKKRVGTTYPEAARAMGMRDEEYCIVRIQIGTDGIPKSAVPADSCPTVFRPAASETAMKWEFYPLTENGRAIEVQFDLRFVFKLR